MNKKVLFCATVDYHFRAFHLPYLKWFKEQGWEVHVAASGNIELPFVDQKFSIPIQRSPFNKINISAYKQLKNIIDQHNYRIIHCHTPMGGVLTRLAAREARNKKTKVIYTAHGFHFCKGAPFLNWLLYYPIEKALSRFTDSLITINHEDFTLAQTHHFQAGSIKHVHGVGVNTEQYKPVESIRKNQLRKQYGYAEDQFLMFYAAEFNKNKNQQLLIQSLALIKDQVPQAKLLLAGAGPLLEECKELAAKLAVERMIDFLGYRNDIEPLLKMCDIALASSYREGLPVNIMEAMACGLPVIATDNRGHRELIQRQKTGWLIEKQNAVEFSKRILTLANNNELCLEFGRNGRNRILANYSMDKVLEEKISIYSTYIDGEEGVLWAIR